MKKHLVNFFLACGRQNIEAIAWEAYEQASDCTTKRQAKEKVLQALGTDPDFNYDHVDGSWGYLDYN